MFKYISILLFFIGAKGQRANPETFCYNFPSYTGAQNIQEVQEKFNLCPQSHPVAFRGGQKCCKNEVDWSANVCDGEEIDCSDHCCERLDSYCEFETAFNKTQNRKFNGLYSQVDDVLEANRTVYQKNDSCVWWHRGGRHWWIGHCQNIGTDSGYAYLEEDYYCPYGNGGVLKGTWRKGDNNKIIKGIDVVDGRTFEARKHNLPQQGSAQDAVAVAVEDGTATTGVNEVQQDKTYRQPCKPKFVSGRFLCDKANSRP